MRSSFLWRVSQDPRELSLGDLLMPCPLVLLGLLLLLLILLA